MAKTYGDVEDLMRRIIGENDGDDPDATSNLLVTYISNFVKLVATQDMKSHDLWSWFEFSTTSGEDTYTFKDQGYANIRPPIYCIDSNNADTKLRYFESPDLFYKHHPVNNSNEQSGRPSDLLFYNNIMLIRPKADAVYTIRIRAYKELSEVTDTTTAIDQDYYLRYYAYGASLDYFADFGNIEDYNKILPIFNRYRKLVMNRKSQQAVTQRARQAL